MASKLPSCQTTLHRYFKNIKKIDVRRHSIDNHIDYTYSMKSFNMNCLYNDATPGDVVMTHASRIGHPLWCYGEISPNYLIFGVVVRYLYHKNDRNKTCEMLDIEWYPVKEKYNWVIKPPQNQDVEVVAKFNDSTISDMNIFVRAEILRHFYYISNEGWFLHMK